MSTLFCRNGRSDSLVVEGRLAGGDCVAVTVTDGNTCSVTSAPTAITVHPDPVVTISGPASACDSASGRMLGCRL